MGERTTFRFEDEYITMVRGDSLAFAMVIEGLETDLTGAYFSAKKNLEDDDTYIFQKTLGNGINKLSDGVYSVRVAPEDTADTILGCYYYDLRVQVGSDIVTVKRGVLEIVANVTEVYV